MRNLSDGERDILREQERDARECEEACFDAQRWVEGEVDQMMDLYGNSRRQALRFILELLQADEYDDLEEHQVTEAILATQSLLR